MKNLAQSYIKIIMLAVSLIIIAVIFPIALGLIGNAGNVVVNASIPTNESGRILSDVIDPTVLTLLVVLLPIIAIISVVMYFLPKSKSS